MDTMTAADDNCPVDRDPECFSEGAAPEGLADETAFRMIIDEVLEARLQLLETRLADRLMSSTSKKMLITERELAAMLGCDPRTVRRLERAGDLPKSIRLGDSKRWRLKIIEAWLDDLPQGRAG